MNKETEELFKTMATQFVSLIDCNNKLMVENLRLMKLNKELEYGKRRT